ncbi:hypothetical protein LJB87_00340 [Alistipes sp. OttesenSCG-928-L06]|nr:hypothetical protein [Alistipes sp. OttesenSCG-928-L06]
MATYAKLADGQLITTCVPDDDPDTLGLIVSDGFKLYDEDAGKPEVGQFQSLNPVYHETEDRITLWWEVINDDPELILMEITRLEELIAATDYKVVKSYEYAIAGAKSVYDFPAIHAEREGLRGQIRELEQLLVPADNATIPIEPDDPLVSIEEIPPGIVNTEKFVAKEVAEISGIR